MGLYWIEFKPRLVRYRWHLLVATVVMAILVLVEYAVVDQLNGPEWLGPGFGGFTKFPYSLFLILSYLAFDKSYMPLADEVSLIGTKSLGIYLGNIPSIYVAAILMYRLTPSLLGYQLVYFVILVLVGLGVPLLLMEAVRRSPVRHRYRILFG
jgi:peptidoglycan/LPS O-acetylase OafA/YrhL